MLPEGLLDDSKDAAANMPPAIPRGQPMRPVVVPPRVEPLSPSLQGKAAEIEADRARMYGRNAPALQAAGITPGQVDPNRRNVPPAPPASSVTPGQMRPRPVTPTPSPTQLRMRQFRTPTTARPTDPDLARIWDAAFVEPYAPMDPNQMSSNPGTRGMQEDTQNMRQNGAVVDHLQKTGGNLDQYQRDLATQNAQAQMAAAGVNADNMASVGLGPKARQPFRPSGFSTSVDAKPKVVSPGADGAPDISQQDVIARISGTPKGQRRPSFSEAKKAMEAEREMTQAPLRRERAAQQEKDDAKQEKDAAAKAGRLKDLEKQLNDLTTGRGGQETVVEPIDRANPALGTRSVSKPVNRPFSPEEEATKTAIENEIDFTSGKRPRNAVKEVLDAQDKHAGWKMRDGSIVTLDGTPLSPPE